MSAPPRWPPKSDRGCTAGARVRPNRNTTVPPKEATNNGAEGGSMNHRTVPSAAAAPIEHAAKRNVARRSDEEGLSRTMYAPLENRGGQDDCFRLGAEV